MARSDDLKARRGAEKLDLGGGDALALGLITALPTLLGGAFGGSKGAALGADESSQAISALLGRADAASKTRAGQLEGDIDAAEKAEGAAAQRDWDGKLKAAELVEKESQAQRDFGRTKDLEGIRAKNARELEAQRGRDALAREQVKLAGKDAKARVTPAEGVTEGRKAADKDFAKDYNDWTTTGRATAEKNLGLLRGALAKLKQNPSIGGRFEGRLPDIAQPTQAITTREDVRAAAQGALKASLGSAFTEKEGERIMNAAYNPTLPAAENVKKIEAALAELEGIANSREARSNYFAEHGTLTGFEAADPGAPAAGGGITPEAAAAELARRRAAKGK